ncbi:MAG TPA: hypothetical protein PLP14_09655, partial [Chitinophagaceae bacterium]|nr:hypothetical protein [Chitinophagaceae bacterium]
MKQFALVLLAMVLNGNLFAQDLHSEGDLNRNITPYHEAADEANASSVAYLQKQEAWKNFRNQHPGWGARFNRYTRLPHRAF